MILEIKKNKFLIILFMLFAFFIHVGSGDQKAFASTAPEVEWEKTFFKGVWDEGKSVEQTTDGGYIITGTTTSSDTGQDVYLIKTNSDGNIVWEKTFGGQNEASNGYSVQQTTDGGYIIAGDTNARGGWDVYLIKTDSVGNTVWEKIPGGQNTVEDSRSVKQTIDGGYIITGSKYNTGVLLMKTDGDGNIVWEKTFGGNGGNSVQQTTDGGYIVAGNTFSVGDGDVYLIKTDSDGNIVWEKTFGSPNQAEYGSSVQQTTDGGYIVAGSTNIMNRDSSDIYLIKTDSDGNTVWEKTFGSPNADLGNSVQQTFDGGYIVTGYSNVAGNSDVHLVKTDVQGNIEWEKNLNGNCGNSVQQTTDGGYIVAGSTLTENGMRSLLIKLKHGEFKITSTYPENGAHEIPNEVVISFNRDITWGFMSNNISIIEESPDGKKVFNTEQYNFATISGNKLTINWEWKDHTKYIINIPAGSINDLTNNPLEYNFELVFYTGNGEMPPVGDINGDYMINLLDLLWVAAIIGPANNEDALKADINNDGQVNILDLLIVEQNIDR
ncbi:MAG: Ig-like domain-containing protein [Bacillota bacterium]|nr:Ig-like domain-containing protein [Bacillota bacterium]